MHEFVAVSLRFGDVDICRNCMKAKSTLIGQQMVCEPNEGGVKLKQDVLSDEEIRLRILENTLLGGLRLNVDQAEDAFRYVKTGRAHG